MIRFENINSPINIKSELNNDVNKLTPANIDNNSAPAAMLPDIKLPLAVNIPAGYTKLGVNKLYNGQEIHNYKLSNGLRVSIVPMDTNFTMIKTFVNTGAVNEYDNQRGISHFLEHMAFNGTLGADGYKKLSTGDVFRIVGNIGGDTNASTNFALTDYYIQAPIFYDSDLEEIISIQGAMMNSLALPDNMIEKERGPVISEINMYTDYPDSTAYNLALKNLYNIKTTSDDYVAGRVENIKNFSRDDVLKYYRNNYYPANMYTTLAGDVDPDEAIKLIAKHFHTKIENPPQRTVDKLTPIDKTIRRDFYSAKTKEMSGYIIFNGPANNNLKDAIIMQFISELLVGNSNALITEHFVNKHILIDLNSEKVSTNPNDGAAVFFGFTGNDEKTEFILQTIYDEIANFKKPSNEQVEIIKRKLLTLLDKRLQSRGGILSILGNSHFTYGDNSICRYRETIQSITAEDIERCVKQYLDLNKASIAIVHPQDKIPADVNLSFTGLKEKRIIIPDNLHIYNLSNNYEAAAYDTNSDYRYLNLEITNEIETKTKPGTATLLDFMLSNGTANLSRKELKSLFVSNLISNSILAYTNKINIYTHADKKDMKLAVKLLKEQLLHPNFTEENLQLAKKTIKEATEGYEIDSEDLIVDYMFKNDPFYHSRDEILQNIDSITLDDIKNLYKEIITNGTGNISFTTSQNEPAYTENILKEFSTLPKAKHKTYKLERSYYPNETPKILTSENNNSQADLRIGYKFKHNQNLRDTVIFNLLSSLLSKNAFNDLREKQQLAYHVNSYLGGVNDAGILYCSISTTTEDEETGEKMYDNVQKSFDGFQNLINDLKNGNFTDEELEAVKREYKGIILAVTDNDSGKLDTISSDLCSPYGALTSNLEYSIIDTISREEIIKAANYVFNNLPVYGITATKDTIENNKQYFDKLCNTKK